MHYRLPRTKKSTSDRRRCSVTIEESSTRVMLSTASCSSMVRFRPHGRVVQLGGIIMSGQVVLYFEDQADALRFALAAGSVMAGGGRTAPPDLLPRRARLDRAPQSRGR